ncbi:MAG: threonine synthase [Oscillospiraceae bacterium]|nr:threonine synthase [Oscillospiraceae bacterium]
MQYQSTRGAGCSKYTSAAAISQGLASDGGLFAPDSFPTLTQNDINALIEKSYSERAAYVMSLFLADFTLDELNQFSKSAYSTNRDNGFYNDAIAPLYKFNDNTYFLELWHGPTCAFKDMALQIMPRLLIKSLEKVGESRNVCILVATSGDTGKAALEGFCDIPGTKIMVFYPNDGVSEVQELQMTSQLGSNVNVVAIEGNFDDAQTGVKNIFADKEFCEEVDKMGYILSSANSINVGRLIPQVAYYVSSYCDLVKNGEIEIGEKINFCVPTGNFGNILAAYYAERMGLPINKLICASNSNDVLTQFITTGVYDKNRPFYTTVSPSMDILVSSNLERLLFELSGKNGDVVSSYMSSLSADGIYSVDEKVRSELNRIFDAGYCSEDDTKKTIKDTFDKHGYLIDTHTAVAYKVLNDYISKTGDDRITVVVSTASPFKFCEAVLESLGKKVISNGIDLIYELSEETGCDVPAPLDSLKNCKSRFNDIVSVSEMSDVVKEFVEK